MGTTFGLLSTPQFEVHVVTGDRRGAGTDANVWLVIHDDHGRKSPSVKLNKWWRNDHERDTTSVYEVSVSEGFGPVTKVEFWRDSVGFGDAWFVDRFEVHHLSTKKVYYFPVHRWVAANVHYFIYEYDCSLPEDDHNKQQRQAELRRIREEYQIKVHVPGGPAQSWKLPHDEKFKGDYKWDIIKTKGSLLLTTSLINLASKDKWESLEDLKTVYKFSLEEPKCVQYWTDDKWFGLQRVQGANPVLITLCTEIPSKFGVEPEMVKPFLEGLTLEKALLQKRLFIVDLKILKDVACKDARMLTAPIALFFLNDRKELMPIAIQLFQDKGPDNPVFLPSDPEYTWLLAKIFYNNADATYHQSCTHLGFTHLLMEGVVVCTHRNLSPSHPLFKLMAPHFLYLLAINARGLEKLISENGWVDTTMTVGRCGMFQLIKRGLKQWHVDVNGIIPNDFRARNVDDPAILPNYPYRDDSTAIYKAVRNYVTRVLQFYYDKPEKVINDVELQNWREELVLSRNEGGIGLVGVPGENEKFTMVEQVIDMVTVIIAICSIGHAAANFLQYEEYGFPPNYPGIVYSEVPKDKGPHTLEDVLKTLPDKETSLDIMVITKLLSRLGTKPLGDFEVKYLYHPVCLKAAEKFCAELKDISTRIQVRNESAEFPYPWLDPKIVPNSISI
ncbi:allene oxide synthase-lipoxygenase protein-like isoform X1 [Limulus polyphemus]|uniref:Allene oxide synthase-lipoxygenase protein-like isoform X1 n=1 Tax=Limulus polyphemus TaxID=6850 RepID=A0ABM1TIN0_LIMPO|nr:allene oxide synthase-lipoxygenase protein-like isoform X1 [Limulus polyphemus]